MCPNRPWVVGACSLTERVVVTKRIGRTLLELVVVVAALSALLALLLPAVLRSRQAARDAVCQNRFRQVAVANHNHQSTFATFPDAEGYPWTVSLLPFLERDDLHMQFDPNLGSSQSPNDAIAAVEIPPLLCPTVPEGEREITQMKIGTQLFNDEALGLAPRDFSDGLSQTVITFDGIQYHLPWIEGHAFQITLADIDASLHPSLHSSMGDGSVHRIAKTISVDVLEAICTPDGGEVAR